MTTGPGLNDDFLDILRALVEADVDFVVVGAHAMAVHGVPRATGDLDVLVRPSRENAIRVLGALRAFGAPTESHAVARADFEEPGNVYQLGLPPRRIDLLTGLSGLDFDEAWATRRTLTIEGMQIPFLGLDALRRNKQATGRERDLVDLKLLRDAVDETPDE